MNNENNFNFKLPKHNICSSIMVSVLYFESEYPGSSPEKGGSSFQMIQAKFFYDGLTDNSATYVTIDLRIQLRGH